MRPREWLALGVSLVAAAAGPLGCGYPQFSFTGAGGSGGSGGATASSHHSAGAGAGTPGCQLLDDTSCPAGQKCTVENPGTGALGCVTVDAPPLGRFDACTDDQSCPPGTWCNLFTSVCSPFCTTSSDCKPGSCVPATDGNGNPIPGVSICTAHCDPVLATPCGTGATCIDDPPEGDFDCAASGFVPVDGPCGQSSDCGRGLVCAGNTSTDGLCSYWCEPANSNAPDCYGTFCNALTDENGNPITYGGATYGYCG